MAIASGTVHKLAVDLKKALNANANALSQWNSLTPLARNEYICWVISAKQAATRERRIKRTIQELNDGERRPCCWVGCIHRTDKAISPSVKGILKIK